jgi:hypothetical protein
MTMGSNQSRLSKDEAEKVRELVITYGADKAARILGLCRVTLLRAASEDTITVLSLQVIRANLPKRQL